ncbi:MAG: hybrid sensor histidine kinase/response regulator [Candidatus Parabeggiatoa sp. nov. 1]|nr:MAG: hybrid sensor histidine kinase/response regulator [Gammaproteobacteria bacterium]
MSQKSLILIVDDHPHNLQVLGNILKKEGYSPALTQNGVQALEFVKKKQPYLILLDIMMPEMSGLEVCRKLKQSPATKDIPVIFLTAKTETEDIVEGLELGAVDYVTKPFNHRELMARINTHIELKTAKQLIVLQKEQLKQTVEELKQANATKDKLFSIITHDLKNLFNALLGFSEELVNNNNLDTEGRQDIQVIQQTSKQGYKLLKNLLEWAKSQTGKTAFQPTTFNLKAIVAINIELLTNNAQSKNITILSDILETTLVFADENMLNTVLKNLLSNAIKFTPANGTVAISCEEKDTEVEISISDTGIGIKPEDIDKLFKIDVSHTTIGTGKEEGTGLGLILCKELVEKNGGSIWVEGEEGKGSRFYIRLPSQQKEWL